MDKPMNTWSQNTLIKWVNKLDSIKQNNKQKIIDGINEFGADGSLVYDADKDDLAESFNIGGMLSGKLFKEIENQRDEAFKYKQSSFYYNATSSNNEETFSINLNGAQGKHCLIDKMKSSYTVKYLKQQYLEHYGKDANIGKNIERLRIRRMNTDLENDKTLAHYNIVNDMITLQVIFRVDGGSEEKKENDTDKYRIRKLRHKKYKEIILSNDADCIMGYTNKDGIKRAKMPCGCSFASDTMYRFMKSVFEQENNFRSITMQCPMPRNQCKGTLKEREWDWSLVFIVSDLSENEKLKYNKIISNRMTGIKYCPHCGTNSERPKDLRIFRVKCKHCNKPDWCWECQGLWKGTKSTSTVCGNSGCIADRLNKILKHTNWINENMNSNCGWTSNICVPDIRHCPNCFTIIEYVKDCRHMTCTGCPHQFCFKCLAPWKGHNSSNCTAVAPIQQIK